MRPLQIVILVLAVLLIFATGFNVYVDTFFKGWAIYISWLGSGLTITISIILLVLVIRNLGKKHYIAPLIMLYLSEIIYVFVFVMFIINNLVNYPKIIAIGIISSLIVIVHRIMRELGNVYGYPIDVGEEHNQQMYYQQSPS